MRTSVRWQRRPGSWRHDVGAELSRDGTIISLFQVWWALYVMLLCWVSLNWPTKIDEDPQGIAIKLGTLLDLHRCASCQPRYAHTVRRSNGQ